jgi:hypothetical protein
MKICLSRFGFIGIVAQDFQSWKDKTIIGWFTTTMIRSIFFILLLAISLVPISFTQTQFVNASSESPYESGRDHGCDDADISDPDDRYINQPDKGPSHHTNEFMRGYHAGYNSCSGDGSESNNDNDNGNGGGGGGDTFSDGQRVGKSAGYSDAINGRPSDASCGSGHSNSYCLGYKLGYNVEYQVTRFAQD